MEDEGASTRRHRHHHHQQQLNVLGSLNLSLGMGGACGGAALTTRPSNALRMFNDLPLCLLQLFSSCLFRALAKKWSVMLFLGTCLLYCSRMTMPICVVAMAESFRWSKIDSGIVLGGFFWGYCFTQILGGHASDR